jgi:hypothetical protein
MLKPREANMPETCARTPGWFCTSADRTWRIRPVVEDSLAGAVDGLKPSPAGVDIDAPSFRLGRAVYDNAAAILEHNHQRIYVFKAG